MRIYFNLLSSVDADIHTYFFTIADFASVDNLFVQIH